MPQEELAEMEESIDIYARVPHGVTISNETIRRVVGILEEELSLTKVEREYISFTLKKENVPTQDGFSSWDKGTFRGLGQFDRKTWKGLIRNGWDLPLYKTGVTSPYYDIKAIVFLVRDNGRVYSNQFGKGDFPDIATAYLYHNQGAGAAKAYLQGDPLRNPGQSKEALALFESIDRSQYV